MTETLQATLKIETKLIDRPCPDCGDHLNSKSTDLFMGIRFCDKCIAARHKRLAEYKKKEDEKQKIISGIRQRLDKSAHGYTSFLNDAEKLHFGEESLCGICNDATATGFIRLNGQKVIYLSCLVCPLQD